MNIAVIGGGISGVSIARLLQGYAHVTVFEKNPRIGGLIACEDLPTGLYHKLGGHVFNTKSQQVSHWFWQHFDRENEFHYLIRNAQILIDQAYINYPIENNIYQLPEALCGNIIGELLAGAGRNDSATASKNLGEFFLKTFGKTLCETYFFPYNEKIWRCDLSEIALDWLEGKLPMPKLPEILSSNILRKPESAMVHARFYYPKKGGSQFVIDRLAEGLNLRCNTPVTSLKQTVDGLWQVNDEACRYDHVVYCGDVRQIDSLLGEVIPLSNPASIKSLRTRGITNVFCECDRTDISWLYLPGREFKANRIIYTGGFSSQNNFGDRMTCVVEFLHGESMDNIQNDIARLPGNLAMQSINHVRDAYIIPQADTRQRINELKQNFSSRHLHLLGRFAEWEYYNIDKCIESAINLRETILHASAATAPKKVA
ncbi:MAG TPA: FAD-dependent oxidoreductase [Opitutaceae bacterium]|nr:FAD-dependent oxidoreductase [Opitutaceae bacterium]